MVSAYALSILRSPAKRERYRAKGFAKAEQASCKLARRDSRALEVGQTRSYKLERDIRTLTGVLRCENIFS